MELKLVYHVKCQTNYYGNECLNYCVPIVQNGSHFDCTSTDGSRQCQVGWFGPVCNLSMFFLLFFKNTKGNL